MLIHCVFFLGAWAHASYSLLASDPNFTESRSAGGASLDMETLASGGTQGGGSGASAGSGGGAGGGGASAQDNPDDHQAALASSSASNVTAQASSSSSVASMASSVTDSAASQPASLETQQQVLSSAAASATPQSAANAVSASQMSTLSYPTTDDGSAANTGSSSTKSSSDNNGSLDGGVTNIRTALFGSSQESADQKLTEDTLYRYYQWVMVRQEAASLRKSFADPLGTKTLGHSLDIMLSSLDPAQSVLGTYSLVYGDTMNWGLQVNADPLILPMNMLVSQLLSAILFPVVQPNSDLTGYTYATPDQNLTNNKGNLSYHAQQLAESVSKQSAVATLAQHYIYLSALGLQLKSCAVNYQPATNSSSASSASSSISALTNSLGASSGGTNSSYFLIPPDTDLSTYTNGLTGMTPVTCSANICAGGSGQGCPPVGSNYDAQGNGFPGILNVLNILSQSISVNPQSDAVAAEHASMVLLSNQQYKGTDLPDVLGCMNAVTLFGEKAIIKCQAANVAVVDMMSAYYLEKTNQSNLGGDLNAQGISSGTTDGLNFVKKMGGKVGIAIKRLNDLMPIVAASAIYQSSYQYFLTQVIPSATLAHMPAQELSELNRVYSSAPPASVRPSGYQEWFNKLMSKITAMTPAPKGELGAPSRTTAPLTWMGSQFLFGQQADSNDLLVAMSSQSFVESLLNAVMSTPYVAGLPIPKNTVDSQGRLYQWVSLAGSFYLLSSDGVTGSWFRSKTLNTTGATKYQIAVSSASAGESMWNQRKTYLAALSKAVAQQNNIVMHDASVQSWALTQIKNYEYERSVQYNYRINHAKGDSSSDGASTQSYTPMQILTEVGRWRLNPSYRWRESLDRMDTDQLLRELLYLVSEQQLMMTRLILDVEDMKLMKSVDFYNNGASTANNMGMGPLADIQANINNYVAGSSSSSSFSTSNMQQMQEDAQQSMSDSLQSAQSLDATSAVNSMLPSSLTGSSSASSAASIAMPSA